MFNQLLAFFDQPKAEVHTLTVDEAAAVLLIEVMMADGDLDDKEQDCIRLILSKRMGISADEVGQCIEKAMQRQQETTDLYPYVQIINEQYGEQKRFDLVVDLWKVAFADGRLDKYEDHRIRRVCDMLHLHHSHFIRAKMDAQ